MSATAPPLRVAVLGGGTGGWRAACLVERAGFAPVASAAFPFGPGYQHGASCGDVLFATDNGVATIAAAAMLRIDHRG